MTKHRQNNMRNLEQKTVILHRKTFKNSNPLSQNEPISKLCDLKHTKEYGKHREKANRTLGTLIPYFLSGCGTMPV